MKRIFSCSSSQVAVEKWNRRDQKLLEAVQRGDVGRVAALASRKSARPTKLDSNGQSPFHLAASNGLTECLTILLANGADINSKNEDGSTALHLATISCQPQCVKVLLQHGANEDAVDAENRSPLHWAASSGCASSVLLLCDHEAFLDVLDNDGRTPLMIASLGGYAAICSQLLQRGARVNVTDKDDKSALILACEKGSSDVAELLLSHGADAGAVDSSGHNALDYALRTQDKELWRLLQQALNRRRRGGHGLVQHPDHAPQASPSGPQVGSPPKSSWGVEPEEEQEDKEEEERCSEEWKCRYEEERKKVSQLEQELARKAEECKAGAAAFLGLETRIREQVQELEHILLREPGDPGRQGPGLRPGGDGMEQGCPLTLLAERIQELKKQQRAAATAEPTPAPEKAEELAPAEIQREARGKSQQEQGRPQNSRPESIGNGAGRQPNSYGGQNAEQVCAGQKARPPALGTDPAGALGEPAGLAAMDQLLLQLREELAAVWREKDAARGALSRPVLEGALGAPRAEAAAAAWEKMEARLERVLVRLDRAKAGLQVRPEAPAQRSRDGAPKAVPGCIKEQEEKTTAPGARGEPLGAPGGEQASGGGLAKGPLEKEVSALRLSNSNLLEELGELGRERQRLQGELQSLTQRLQREFVPKPEAQVQLQQLRQDMGSLTQELAAEKEATETLRRRLASHNSCLQRLWNCLPPDLAGKNSGPLEELQACISTLADKYQEAQQVLARLEEENQQLRASRAPCGEPEASPQVAALEEDLGKLEGELRAVQATMSGKSQEICKLKKLLYQATEEVAELRAREAASLRQHEKTRGSLVAQAQAWGQELKAVLEKYNTACREMARLRDAAAEERRRSEDLAARAAEQERQAGEMRGRSEQFEKTAELLKEKTEHLIGACRDKEAKVRGGGSLGGRCVRGACKDRSGLA
nr:ankyrin repeat domain-containing protein 35 [Meriones unguiculatus]